MNPLITTVVLAGGQGTRIGGDKGLQTLHGRALIAWVLDAVRNQSDELLISANDEGNKYAGFSFPVIADQITGRAGPLAGLQAALRCARHNLVVSVPCDSPFLPDNLIARLYESINRSSTAEAAVAVVEGRRQPVIALYRKNVLSKLDAYLKGNQRKVGGWLDLLQAVDVVFEEAAAFININSSEELAGANQTNDALHTQNRSGLNQ